MPAVATRFLRVDSITPHRTADYALQRIADNVGYSTRRVDVAQSSLLTQSGPRSPAGSAAQHGRTHLQDI